MLTEREIVSGVEDHLRDMERPRKERIELAEALLQCCDKWRAILQRKKAKDAEVVKEE